MKRFGWQREERPHHRPSRQQREREDRIRSLDERIAEDLKASAAEIRSSPAFGRPLPDDGFFDAPPELRMAFLVLKNAGHVPVEVAQMQEMQGWRDELARMSPGAEADALRRRIAERELLLKLRIERLARTLSL